MIVPFEYYQPTSLAEATELLARLGPAARPLAGGTALLPALERGQSSAAAVVNLKAIPGLRDITLQSNHGLSLGALVTLADLIQSPVIQTHAPVLAATARQMATPQVRHQGTVGGNLCHATPAADLLVSLLALDARVDLVGPPGPRTVPLTDWIAPWGGVQSLPGEILTFIHIPPVNGVAVYHKFTVREAVDVALANVAVVVAAEAGRVTHARIAVGANGPRPTRAVRVEHALLDRPLDRIAIDAAADLVIADYYPADDARASRWYRQAVTRVLVQRALTACG